MTDCDCSSLVLGVHHTVPVEGPTGLTVASVESCDLCERFDSDLVAAAALRDFLGGGVVMFHDGSSDVEWRGDESVMIATETSPWIENAPVHRLDETIDAATPEAPCCIAFVTSGGSDHVPECSG